MMSNGCCFVCVIFVFMLDLMLSFKLCAEFLYVMQGLLWLRKGRLMNL
jgi:hypothetical protein